MEEKFIKKYERKTRMRKRESNSPLLLRLREKAQRLFDKFEALVQGKKRLRRKGGSLTGVSATLANYLEVKPALIRLAFIAGLFFSWTTILIYAALAFIIPSVSDPAEKKALEGDWMWEEEEEEEPEFVDYKLCEHCDTALKPHAKFCHSCGNEVPDSD